MTAARCPNCQAPLADPPPKFCPECGQETQVRAPTIGEFIQQFGGAFLSTEGALWRTLKLLLFKPGELTVQYLAGRRKHYVLPLRLYLTISLIVLLALRWSAITAIETQPDAVVIDGTPGTMVVDLGWGRAGMKDGAFFCESLPKWVCARLQRRLDHDKAGLQREARGIGERVVGNLGAAMFLLLPGFALALKLVYWNRRLRYTEHLVFALHVHAFWFAALGLTLLPGSWLEAVALVGVPLYTLLAMKRVYGGRWWSRLVRSALVSLLYLCMLTLALMLLALWAALA